MDSDKSKKRTLLTGFSPDYSRPKHKPSVFCKYVPNVHNIYIDGAHCLSERFQEVANCPLMAWAESNQGRFTGFYYLHDVMMYCHQHKEGLPHCPLLEYIFNKDENLIKSVIIPPFTPTSDIPNLIKLLEWFISEEIVVPKNGDIQPVHNRFFFYAYHEMACIKIISESILPWFSSLHNSFETRYEYAYRERANDLKRYWDELIDKAREADAGFQQNRQQGWNKRWEDMVNDRLFLVKQAANCLRSRLLSIERDLQREAGNETDEGEQKELTDTETYILEALGDEAMRGQKLLIKAGYDYSSHYKTILSNLVKRGILKKTDQGYKVTKSCKSQ